MKEQSICAQTGRVTKVSSCDQIRGSNQYTLTPETEEIDLNDSIINHGEKKYVAMDSTAKNWQKTESDPLYTRAKHNSEGFVFPSTDRLIQLINSL